MMTAQWPVAAILAGTCIGEHVPTRVGQAHRVIQLAIAQQTRRLVGLLRQSVFGRLAGYEDANDADRLCRDPAMR